MNPRARRSRTFWPDALTVAGVGEGHTHNVAPRYKRIFVLLIVLLVFLALTVGTIWYRVLLSGAYREQQLQQIREEVRQGQCDLLDTFPEDLPPLERARTKYGCGPGIPLGLLTPDEQARITGRAPTPTPTPTATATPPLGSPASPGAPRSPVNTPTAPREGPGPEPASPSPLVDLGPITGPVCDLAGVCV